MLVYLFIYFLTTIAGLNRMLCMLIVYITHQSEPAKRDLCKGSRDRWLHKRGIYCQYCIMCHYVTLLQSLSMCAHAWRYPGGSS